MKRSMRKRTQGTKGGKKRKTQEDGE